MNHHDLQSQVEALLERRRLTQALELVRRQALEVADQGRDTRRPRLSSSMSLLVRELDSVAEDYGLLCRYALDGMDDPHRAEILRQLSDRVRSAASTLVRQAQAADSPTLYFSTLRYRDHSHAPSLEELLELYLRAVDRLSLAQLQDSAAESGQTLRKQAEELEKQAFNALWTQHPLTQAQTEAVGGALRSLETPEHFKLLLVSALMLGQMQWPDEQRLRLLMDIYAEPTATDALQVRALCALLLGLWQWRARSLSAPLRARYEALAELPHFPQDVRMALLEFIRTRDAERINREFTQEILPQMRDLAPEMRQMMDYESDPQENPEWEELMEKSGLAERLRKMQQWQEEGADVMMTTFQKLKSFAFFNEISNWFLPFQDSHSAIADAASQPGFATLGRILADAPILCDSDKYSVVLSLNNMPEVVRKTFLGQMTAYSEQMEQARGDQPRMSRQDIANKYVQDLHRFYRMFRRKEEFANPFDTPVNLPAHPLLAPLFDHEDTLRLVGEFYFKRGYWADAEEILDRLGRCAGPSAELMQKLGYCRQRQNRPQEALQYYEQAELLDGASDWTLRRMAACHRALGHHAEALDCYGRLAQAHPDDPNLEISMGNTLLAQQNYAEALKHYFKAEYLRPGDERVSRPIAWASLMTGNLERARQYYDRLLSTPEAQGADLLNAGHMELLSGDRRSALGCYRAAGSRMKDFAERFAADKPMLISRGIPEDLIGIIADQI